MSAAAARQDDALFGEHSAPARRKRILEAAKPRLRELFGKKKAKKS